MELKQVLAIGTAYCPVLSAAWASENAYNPKVARIGTDIVGFALTPAEGPSV
jgi:hypothetical protein